MPELRPLRCPRTPSTPHRGRDHDRPRLGGSRRGRATSSTSAVPRRYAAVPDPGQADVRRRVPVRRRVCSRSRTSGRRWREEHLAVPGEQLRVVPRPGRRRAELLRVRDQPAGHDLGAHPAQAVRPTGGVAMDPTNLPGLRTRSTSTARSTIRPTPTPAGRWSSPCRGPTSRQFNSNRATPPDAG